MCVYYVCQAVSQRADKRVIYVAPPTVSMLGFSAAGNGPKKVKKTTYFDYESEKASQMASQTMVNAALMAFMSLKFDIHLPLVTSHTHTDVPAWLSGCLVCDKGIWALDLYPVGLYVRLWTIFACIAREYVVVFAIIGFVRLRDRFGMCYMHISASLCDA